MITHKKTAALIGVMAVSMMLMACLVSSASAIPRSQELVTGGTQWGNIGGFNPYGGNYAAGTVGLCEETLLRYDPLKDVYINWLGYNAGFGTGANANTWSVTVRSGVTWSPSGDALTAADVAFTLNLGQYKNAFWNNLYVDLAGPATASGNVVSVKFKPTVKPDFLQWQNDIWNIPIVKKSDWLSVNNDNLTKFQQSPTADPSCTGAYKLDTIDTDAALQVVWQKRTVDWWATKAPVNAPDPKPGYVADLVNTNNNIALGLVIHGDEDLNNNYLPNITQLLTGGYGLSTYNAKPPYDLAANTAWLVPNTLRAPMNQAIFRKALAQAVNPAAVVSGDYGNLVSLANATGLLKVWNKYINAALVKKYGAKYCKACVAKTLGSAAAKKAGFKKVGKWWSYKGKKINLKLIVPSGWSDWMTAIDMMSKNLRDAGINVTTGYPGSFFTLRNAGNFDLIIDNSAQISDTPWTYYNYMFNQPILAQQTFANFGRYGANSPKASAADKTNANKGWALVDKLDKVPVTASTAAKNVYIKQLQQITLTQLPIIPLWYNGVWAQWTSQVWMSWPGGATTRHYMPCMWRGYLQMTGIDMIDHLVKVPPPKA
jgi:peptide/nickel transport system substrate-binding protein